MVVTRKAGSGRMRDLSTHMEKVMPKTLACHLSNPASAQIAEIDFKLSVLTAFRGGSLVLQLSSSSTQWRVGNFRTDIW